MKFDVLCGIYETGSPVWKKYLRLFHAFLITKSYFDTETEINEHTTKSQDMLENTQPKYLQARNCPKLLYTVLEFQHKPAILHPCWSDTPLLGALSVIYTAVFQLKTERKNNWILQTQSEAQK